MNNRWATSGTTPIGPAIVNERGETVGAMWIQEDAERVAADHNAMLGVKDPLLLRSALEELRAADRSHKTAGDPNGGPTIIEAYKRREKAISVLLALLPDPETDK